MSPHYTYQLDGLVLCHQTITKATLTIVGCDDNHASSCLVIIRISLMAWCCKSLFVVVVDVTATGSTVAFC